MGYSYMYLGISTNIFNNILISEKFSDVQEN